MNKVHTEKLQRKNKIGQQEKNDASLKLPMRGKLQALRCNNLMRTSGDVSSLRANKELFLFFYPPTTTLKWKYDPG